MFSCHFQDEFFKQPKETEYIIFTVICKKELNLRHSEKKCRHI